MKPEELITDDALNKVFGNADFGSPKRDVVKYSLLKYASGYSTGHTAYVICKELGLIGVQSNLTKLGKKYLYAAFCNNNSF